MQRKLFFILLLLSSLTMWAHDIEIDNIYYKIDPDTYTATVTYKGESYDYDLERSKDYVQIPDTIEYKSEYYAVKYVGSNAFRGCKNVRSVIIPNGVTSIGSSAFQDCSAMMYVEMPNTIKSIDFYAFSNCNLLQTVVIPDSISLLKAGVFKNCESLYAVKFPTHLDEIMYDAFSGCTQLDSINLPNSISTIQQNVFKNTALYNNKSNWDEGLLYIDEYLIDAEDSLLKSDCIIKEGTRLIANYAFSYCDSLQSVEIPNSVTKIGYAGFYYCTNLQSIHIPNTVKEIGASAFSGCYKLESITLPANLSIIENRLFEDCNNIKTVFFPDSVKSVGWNAFYSCDSLQFVQFNKHLTNINYNAFKDCKKLSHIISYAEVPPATDSLLSTNNDDDIIIYVPQWSVESYEEDVIWGNYQIQAFGSPIFIDNLYYQLDNIKMTASVVDANSVFPSHHKDIYDEIIVIPQSVTFAGGTYSVTSIESNAFQHCKDLQHLSIPKTISNIANNAFNYCNSLSSIEVSNENSFYCSDNGILFSKDKSTIIKYPTNKGSYEYTIPNSVHTIADNAFENNKTLLSINCPDSLKCIGRSAFRNSVVSNVYMSNNISTIGDFSFAFCDNLTSMVFPDNVQTIGHNALYACDSLQYVFIPASVKKIDGNIVYRSSSLKEIRVDSLNNYYSSHNGVLYNKHKTKLISYPIGLTDTEFTILQTVDTIGNQAFENCKYLTSIVVPDNVSVVEGYAFSYCENVETVTIGKGVKELKLQCFYKMDNLKEVTIYSENIQKIGGAIFSCCDSIKCATFYSKEPISTYDIHKFAKLYVPCNSIESYKEKFTNYTIECIQSEEVELDSEKVEVKEDTNSIEIVWPNVIGANTYIIQIIYKGKVVCSLEFNSKGQLVDFDFNLFRKSVEGFKYNISGLESGTNYEYLVTSYNEQSEIIEEQKGTFTTLGEVQDPDIPTAIEDNTNKTDIVVANGYIISPYEINIYNMLGQDVTINNGSLKTGVYIVVCMDKKLKVMIR